MRKALDAFTKSFEHLTNVQTEMTAINSIMGGGPASYYFEKLQGYVEGLFNLSPMQIGDRCVLIETPRIDEGSGWYSSKHFLIKGAKATVHDVDYFADKGFVFDVVFDNETWIDDHKVERPVTRKHTYCFRERYLVKL